MPKNILVDLNVILDVLLDRPGQQASQAILELQATTGHGVYISGHIVTTFAYLLEQAKVPSAEIRRQLNWLLQTFTVVATDDRILKAAVMSPIIDYEDAVIEQAALTCQAALIITRNIKDFAQSAVAVATPESFFRLTSLELPMLR